MLGGWHLRMAIPAPVLTNLYPGTASCNTCCRFSGQRSQAGIPGSCCFLKSSRSPTQSCEGVCGCTCSGPAFWKGAGNSLPICKSMKAPLIHFSSRQQRDGTIVAPPPFIGSARIMSGHGFTVIVPDIYHEFLPPGQALSYADPKGADTVRSCVWPCMCVCIYVCVCVPGQGVI